MPSRRDRHLAKNIEEGDLQYELRHIDWRKRLNALEKNWLPNDGTSSAAYLSQLNEAWEMAYICIWTMRGKNGQYAN